MGVSAWSAIEGNACHQEHEYRPRIQPSPGAILFDGLRRSLGCRHRLCGFSIVDDNILATRSASGATACAHAIAVSESWTANDPHQSAVAVSLFEKPFAFKSTNAAVVSCSE
jgi:hypothetical protein